MGDQLDNGYVRKWQFTVSLVGLLIFISGSIFRAGMQTENLQMKITAIEHHIDYDDSVLARRDVIEQRLAYIEQTEAKIEEMQREQNQELRQWMENHRR